jgi:NAD(P)-dependent dehydrogenase (short-subunit alcohol dehydrogenase family)
MDSKVALITGSGKRLGREIALALSGNGYNVVVNYLKSSKEAKDLVKEISKGGSSAISIKADVTKSSEVKRLYKQVIGKYGRVDVLINNAAIFEKTSMGFLNEKKWQKTIDTNLKSCFLCSMEAFKYMKKQKTGRIINISSIGGYRPFKNYLPYCVSKAGVIMLTECLAKEMAPDIIVNGIAPGMIQFSEESKKLNEILNIEKIPLKRYGKPKDLTDLILFLINSGSYITGQTVIVDGGKVLN